MALHKKLTTTYWPRTMLPSLLFLLVLLCSCSVPGLDNQTTADPSSGSPGVSGASAEEVQIANAVFQAINQERAAHGIAALQWYPALAQSVRQHDVAMDHAGTLSHQLAGEAAPGDRETQQGVAWTWAGENIGETPDLSLNGAMELHQLMMAEKPPEDGHRRNILDGNFNVLGVAVLLDQPHGVLWLTEDFAHV